MARIFQIFNQLLYLILTFVYLMATYFLGLSLGELIGLPAALFYIPFMFFITFSGNFAIFLEILFSSFIVIIYSIYKYISTVDEFKKLYDILATLLYTISKEFKTLFTIFLNSLTPDYIKYAVLFSFLFLIIRYIFILARPPKIKDV